jgi:cell division protein FtsA
MNQNIITAIDIGSSKIFGISGMIQDAGLEVLAAEVVNLPEGIIKQGRIIDIEEAGNCVFEVMEALKSEGMENIDMVTIGIGGSHLKGKIYSRQIEIEPAGREINETDIELLKKELKSSVIADNGNGRKVLYIVPQEYIIDKQNVTRKKPVGMHGNVLEMKVHAITVDINPFQDIINCLKSAGTQVEKVFPHSWAVAESVLSDEEKKLGCLLLDIGKGTTDFAFYANETLQLTDSCKVGGWYVDYDLSVGLHTPLDFAERLKKDYGLCNYRSLIKNNSEQLSKRVDIFSPSGKVSGRASVEEISRIVYERVRELFESFIKAEVEKKYLLNTSGAGVVISGGSSELKGITELAEEVFGLPARKGNCKTLIHLDANFQKPEFACGVGLLMLASKQERANRTTWKSKVKNIFSRWF